MSRFTIGTRGSALALWQAHAVEAAVRTALPDAEVEVRVITTTGDRVLDKPLEQIGDKGLFTKELEGALLAGEVDLCVHSMKDMPTELPEGCVIGAMLPRADVRDVLVCGPCIKGSMSLADVPQGSRLGTGSLRRTAQLRAFHPHVVPLPIRGNVDTRLAKANGPDYEGVVLAAAGVQRMGAQARIAAYLPVEEMVPAMGQGAIGVEVRAGDERALALCAAIDDAATSMCVNAEREVLGALEGGCQAPIGVYARLEGGTLSFDAVVCALDGSRMARVHLVGCEATDVVDALREQGADSLLAEIARAGGER